MAHGDRTGNGRRTFPRLLAAAIALFAIAQAVGGISLTLMGGSSYFVIAAAVMLAGAVLLWFNHPWTRITFHVLAGGTIAWALWETSGELWGMIARVGFFLLVWLLVMWASRGTAIPRWRVPAASIALLVLASGVIGTLVAQDAPSPTPVKAAGPAAEYNWPEYGRTPTSTRFSPLAQITSANVTKLQVAWSYRTGDTPREADKGLEFTFEATPLKIGDTLYFCTPHSIVIALDAETGAERWRHDPKIDDSGSYIKACRGVAYYKAAEQVTACPERILAGTLDGRMVAVDARTGESCNDFGTNGSTSILTGLGPHKKGYAYMTSAPYIIGRVALVSGWVSDNQSVGEPSGVVRAYDVITGKFAWAWDMGRPGDTKEPPPGETFTKGTPNVWPPMSADPALGLVYLPMGNATPDQWAGHRTAVMDKFGSSVVALDVVTGQPRWQFQLVHHDTWDYDTPSAPVLFDFKRGGESIPALAQFTKMGQLFVLDRRTGEPLIPVEERPVPQVAPSGDRLSPTQPFSTAVSLMPSKLTEASMWGLTPLDQIACRIEFHRYRYEGIYTPQTVKGTIQYPAPFGTTDWGGASYDEGRGLLIVPSSYMPFIMRLVPREEADRIVAPAIAAGKDPSTLGIGPQFGTPFGMTAWPMLSPLKMPCIAPPWGLLTAIDPSVNRIVWQHPFGTARDSGPFFWKVGLPIRIGVPSMGGPISTRGGITFIGATLDNYFRAFDTVTGKELWRARTPAGAQATPMTYWSEASGRQFVVTAAGGHGALMTKFGDYIIAYALPKRE
jgi:membrane-bound PQQ-dependent dehydrogenase (glucose/quinate/shikimate family)